MAIDPQPIANLSNVNEYLTGRCFTEESGLLLRVFSGLWKIVKYFDMFTEIKYEDSQSPAKLGLKLREREEVEFLGIRILFKILNFPNTNLKYSFYSLLNHLKIL